MVKIPAPVRAVLIERAERFERDKKLEYDEVVVIDRESIRGKRAYRPELRYMVYGSHGKVCRETTRERWSDSHVETAMVYCEAGWCIAQPVVCGNWSQISPEPEPAVPPFLPPVLPPSVEPAPGEPGSSAPFVGVPLPTSDFPLPPGGVPQPVLGTFGGGAGGLGFGWFGGSGGGGYVVVGLPCDCCDHVPPLHSVTPIPEPAVVASMVMGMALLLPFVRRRREVAA